jgi:hypothetical protein
MPSTLTMVKLIAAGGNHSLASFFSPLVQYPVNVTNDLLLIYNTNSTDSRALKDYYLTNRPMVANANVLGVACDVSESTTSNNCDNQIVAPLLSWLANNPTKHPEYLVLFYDMPTRITNYDPLIYPSVTYRIYSTYSGIPPFITYINAGSLADCEGYVSKLASIGTNFSPGKLMISASAGGYGDTNYFFDDTRDTNTYGVGRSFGGQAQSGVLGVNPNASVTYKHDLLDIGGAGGTNHISFGTNVSGYLCWGDHSSLGPGYATNGPIWSGNSGWWLIQTIESFNGDRYETSQGNFTMWLLPNAFGGTNYSNTPVGAVTYLEEPFLPGNENSTIYFGLWESGKNFAICAWNGRNTPYFQAVGDPFIQK